MNADNNSSAGDIEINERTKVLSISNEEINRYSYSRSRSHQMILPQLLGIKDDVNELTTLSKKSYLDSESDKSNVINNIPSLPEFPTRVYPIEIADTDTTVVVSKSNVNVSRKPVRVDDYQRSPSSSPNLSRRRKLKESQHVNIEKFGDQFQLNQYKLKEAIGEGSYGIVKLVYSEEDEQNYAMKILSKKKLLQKARLFGRRFAPPTPRSCSVNNTSSIENPLTKVYREIALLKKIDHPNVIKLVEILDDPMEDHLYLVFELLKRGEILSVPTSNPLPEHRAWKYFRDIVLGIEYLHFQKIIHRDIKPSNLLLGDDDRIKIADFGICNEFNSENDAMLTSTSGTPAFIAPEALAIRTGSYSGKAADIWQLGVTLYSLVFGIVPFNDNNILNLYSKIQCEPLSFPRVPIISKLLKNILKSMLEKKPQCRISLPDIKKHEWTTRSLEIYLPSQEENCITYVEVTDDEIINCVSSIPKLKTIILVKKMLKNHSFKKAFEP